MDKLKELIGLVTAEMASGATSCCQVINSWRACCGLSESLSRIHVREWLELYTRHGKLQSGVLNVFSPFVPCMPGGEEADSWLREIVRIHANGPEYVKAALSELSTDELQAMFAEASECVGEWLKLAAIPVDQLPEPSIEELQFIFDCSEVVFFFGVWVRAWLEYGETVTNLLWRATRAENPDIEALKKLIRLDARVIHHPLVGRVIHCQDQGQSRIREAAVGQALSRPLSGEFPIGKVKNMLAGLISRVSEMLGDPLNAEEIREIFDSIARENGQLRDLDLPAGKEAWSKAIQRGKPFWKYLPQPDKDSLKTVRALRERAG